VSGKRKSADHPRPQHPLFWPGDSDAMRLTGPVVRSSTDADFVVSHRTRGPRRSGSHQAVLSSRREASCGSSRSAKPNRFSCFIGGLTQSSCTFPACSKRTQTNRRSHPRPPPGSPPVCQWGLRKPETPVPMLAQAVRIWIEALRHADGLPRYNSRGQLYRTRLGGPAGDVLVEQAVSPMCPSCRALRARGITGLFETWKEGVPYACMRGDIEKMAGLTVYEPDDGVVQFARWRPFDQNTVSRSAASAPARNDDRAVRGEVPADTSTGCRARGELLAEAAE
jgi:hypothetical protein